MGTLRKSMVAALIGSTALVAAGAAADSRDTASAGSGAACDRSSADPRPLPARLDRLATTATAIEGPHGLGITFAAYPLPDYEGKPWSHWGEGTVASNGRYYSAIGDHHGPDGNSYLYEFDPSTRTLRAVGDVLTAYGQHRPGAWGYGKVHGPLAEGPDATLYFSTYWGTRRGLEYADGYTGDLLMCFDLTSGRIASLGVPIPEMGTPSTAMWQAGGLLYGEANHPAGKGRPWPEGKRFWAYDVEQGQLVFTSASLIEHGSGRDIAVDREGRAYYSGGGRDLMRYDPDTNREERVAAFPADGKLRASSEPAPDGRMFMVTNDRSGTHAYLFDPRGSSFDHLASLKADTADLALSASGEVAYFTTGAHGQGRASGFPLMEIDRSGSVRTIVELGPLIERAGGPYPAGTYSYSTDPGAAGDIYILANAGPRGTDETFGQPVLIVVHLPPSERR